MFLQHSEPEESNENVDGRHWKAKKTEAGRIQTAFSKI